MEEKVYARKNILVPNLRKRRNARIPATAICAHVIVHYRGLPLATFCFRRAAAASEAECDGSIIDGLLPRSSDALLGLESHPRVTQQQIVLRSVGNELHAAVHLTDILLEKQRLRGLMDSARGS